MNLTDRAISDAARITGSVTDFGVSITLTAPAPGSEVATILGYHIKHHTGYDEEGVRINTKKASIAVSEGLLTAESYPVRINEEVDMLQHRVDVADSSGVVKKYIVSESSPDEKLGLIVLIIDDFLE